MINPFLRIHNEKWIVPVSTLSAVLGFMIFASWITKGNYDKRVKSLPPAMQAQLEKGLIDLEKYKALEIEVGTLRARATALERAVADNSKGSSTLNEQLQEMKAFAGLTELEGPGVKVILKDNAQAGLMPQDGDLIHDIDVLRVTNELYNAGAEAISVNGQRLVGITDIRCAGTIINVNGVKVASPFVISAIGDPEMIYSGFTMNGGVMAEIASASPSMIQATKEKMLRIPPFLGSTTRKFGVVPKVTKK